MRAATLAFAAKSLLVPACLLTLAGCGDAAASVKEETPTAQAVIASPASATAVSEPAIALTIDEPVAALSPQPSPTRAPAPDAGMAACAPPATPTPTATPTTDPHAGHDMSTKSNEEMKAMGHE